MAKHVKLSSPKPFYKRALAVATVLLTLVGSLQISAASAADPVPVLVADINTTPDDYLDPEDWAVVGDTLYFNVSGSLWKSDGTATEVVRHFPYDDDEFYGSYNFVVVRDTLFFVANDGIHGYELWTSDGTLAGTRMVRDIRLGNESSFPGDLVASNGTLLFTADDGLSTDSWSMIVRDDGTVDPPAKTFPAGSFPAGSFPTQVVDTDSTRFIVVDNDGDDELWRIVPNGFLEKVNVGGLSSPAYLLTQRDLFTVNGALFFSASDGSGQVLWMIEPDGVPVKVNAGTSALPIYPSGPDKLVAINDTLFFTAYDGTGTFLWRLAVDNNGTSGAPVRLQPLVGELFNPTALAAVGSNLFFTADDGNYTFLWLIMPGGAPEKVERSPGSGTYFLSPDFLVAAGGNLFFTAGDGTRSSLWKLTVGTNGTLGSRVRLEPVGVELSRFGSFAAVEGGLFFAADDGEHGKELWISDGTPAGTKLVREIVGSEGSSIRNATYVDGTLFFGAYDGTRQALWMIGPNGSTVRVERAPESGTYFEYPDNLVAVNGNLFFTADDGTSQALWMIGSDGVSVKVEKPSAVGTYFEYPKNLVALDGTLLFNITDGGGIDQFYKLTVRTGGTLGSTELFFENSNELYNSSPFFALGSSLFFSAANVSGTLLWQIGPNGVPVKVERSLRSSTYFLNPENFIDVDGSLFFSSRDGFDYFLWMIGPDGVPVKVERSFGSSTYFNNPNYLVAVEGTLFFSANEGYDRFLWMIGPDDVPVKVESSPGSLTYFSDPRNLLGVEGTLFFSALEEYGTFLWAIGPNGVPAKVAAESSKYFSRPHDLIAVDDTLLFSAFHPSGIELWKIVGSDPPVAVAINSAFKYPRALASSGDKIFFEAFDDLHGNELWSLALTSIELTLDTDSPNNQPPAVAPTPTPSPTVPVVTEPSATSAVRFSRFVPDSGKLPALAARGIAQTLSDYSTVDRVVCTGFTSGVRATALGRKVALLRAQNACNVVKRLAPKALIQVRVNVASGVGPKFRSVQLSITGN